MNTSVQKKLITIHKYAEIHRNINTLLSLILVLLNFYEYF